MAQPFTDHEMEQFDAAVARRVASAEWRDCKPTKATEQLLTERADKAAPRRFTGEPITELGGLQ